MQYQYQYDNVVSREPQSTFPRSRWLPLHLTGLYVVIDTACTFATIVLPLWPLILLYLEIILPFSDIRQSFSIRYRTIIHPFSSRPNLSRTLLIIAGLDCVATIVTIPWVDILINSFLHCHHFFVTISTLNLIILCICSYFSFPLFHSVSSSD